MMTNDPITDEKESNDDIEALFSPFSSILPALKPSLISSSLTPKSTSSSITPKQNINRKKVTFQLPTDSDVGNSRGDIVIVDNDKSEAANVKENKEVSQTPSQPSSSQTTSPLPKHPTKRPYRALSLDGGGARGMFTLKLLSLIADDYLKLDTNTKSFADEFDIIVGVSVGGIIGAAIACGLFDDPKIRNRLIQHGSEIFGEKNDLRPLLQPVYKGTEKLDILKLNFKKLTLRDCKCKLVLIVVTSNFKPYFIESWNPKMQDWLLVDCLNATSAVPYFFPPGKINNRYFWDGGMYCNSPTDEAILRLKLLYNPNHEIKPFHFQILSIGTLSTSQDILEEELDECKITNPDYCGLIRLFQLGITDSIGGLYNTTATKLMQYEYGDDIILRITTELSTKFNDISEKFQSKLKIEAVQMYNKYYSQLDQFFSKRV